MDPCLELLQDPVAAVRLAGARLLPLLKGSVALPEDVEQLVGSWGPSDEKLGLCGQGARKLWGLELRLPLLVTPRALLTPFAFNPSPPKSKQPTDTPAPPPRRPSTAPCAA